MTFSDDLENDLANVFYEDYKDEAVIGAELVKGHLSVGDSAFGMDAQAYVFDGPASQLGNIRRGDQLTISGNIYTVVRPDYYGHRTLLILDKN
ncbi:hypothetical protein [Bermanella sp. R86510]|uniref:hypothetical protein n=1 Tax=unclassified Bermanella TaxID=2627862 RepID=UPI0037C671BA